MKISAFTLVTNGFKFQYPFIESIKSWLPIVDELIVIDGGSIDGTREAIEEIGEKKIRIINDKETEWEENWDYSRLGKNFNRGFNECTGDVVIKFDADYILHESAYLSQNEKFNFRKNCERAINDNNLIIGFIRRNVFLIDRYFLKSMKTLAVNRLACRKRNIKPVYGLNLDKWGWGYAPIVPSFKENDIYFGEMLKVPSNTFVSDVVVYNYGFSFCDKETVNWIRNRHIQAEVNQKKKIYDRVKVMSDDSSDYGLKHNPEFGLLQAVNNGLFYLNNSKITAIKLEEHPQIIQKKIRDMQPKQLGYNAFGHLEIASYFK